MKKNNKKHNIFLLTSIFMFTLYFCSLMITSNILAKYADANNETESANVAKFHIETSGTHQAVIPMSYKSDTYTFYVEIINYKNDQLTEVEVTYDVTVSTLNNLPLVLTLSQVSSEGDGTLAQINGLKGTGGTMHSSSKSKHVYKVTIQWDTSDPKYKDVKYSKEIDLLTINFLCEQVD